MCRLRFIEPEDVNPATKKVFEKLVLVPNLLCIMANSDAVIELFASHNGNLDTYKLSVRNRKAIILAVSQFNDCTYCLALHTSGAVSDGILTPEECLAARQMKSPDPRMNELLRFTRAVLEHRGHVTGGKIEGMRRRGFADQEIVEAIATICLICMANYTANVAKPEIEWPEPPLLEAG